MNTKKFAKIIYNKYKDDLFQYMRYQQLPQDLKEIASLRHTAHVKCMQQWQLNRLNQILQDNDVMIEIDSIEEVHNTVNPLLLAIEELAEIDCLASHGCSEFYYN